MRLTGTLADVDDGSIILERDGIGREVLVPQFTVVELAALRGQTVTLHTLEFHEGGHASGPFVPRLLGFLRPDDKRFFQRFLEVKGIGPRKALKALAEPVSRIASWIESGDVKSLARLPGIGPRAAQLVVASLKGKMKDLAQPTGDGRALETAWTGAQRDALEVMVALGDSRADAEHWLEQAHRKHPEDRSTEEWTRLAYRVRGGLEP